MRKPRKRHIQTEIVFKKWGGKRRGAGRPRRGKRRSVPHLRREDFSPHHPLHVTLRVLDDVGRLRKRDAFHVVRKAMLVTATREDFRIVHLSIQGNHLHVICEARSREALSSDNWRRHGEDRGACYRVDPLLDGNLFPWLERD